MAVPTHAAHQHQVASSLLHQPHQLGVAVVGSQAGIPAQIQIGVHQGITERIGLVSRDVEAIVDEKNLPKGEPLFQILNLGHHLVNGANHSPGAFLGLGRSLRSWIIKAAQLGQNTNAESGLPVFLHVQLFQARGLGEFREAAHSIVNDLPILAVNQSRQVKVGGLTYLDSVGQFRKGLASIPSYAQVGLQECEAFLGKDAERRTYADHRGLGCGANPLDNFFGDGQSPLGIQVAVVAEIPQRYTHQLRRELPHRILHFREVIISGKHQVQDF